MAVLSKKSILSADDLAFALVPVPEWGGDVRLRTLSSMERDSFEATVAPTGKSKKANLHNFRARLLAMVIVDDAGKEMFNEAEVAQLGRKSAKAMERLFDKARVMNGFSEEDVQELAKNCSGTASGS